jgi:beta-galactosidase
MKRTLLTITVLSLWAFSAIAQKNNFLSNLSNYIENTDVYESGQEEGRAYHIPESHLSLNGSWKFYYSEVPQGIPEDFFKEGFNDSEWEKIKVPSNWEMEGYGDKLFRNVSAAYTVRRPESAPVDQMRLRRDNLPDSEFSVIPPEVPDEYNPSGAYRASFVLPGDWKGQEVFLRFEKVASASFVWVNGKEVGYNEGAQEPSEYNITPYLRKGVNNVSVFVVKFSDGYYLEGQDYWRLAGIFDDVWVYAAPQVRLFDWQVITDLDENYDNADLTVDVHVKSYQSGGNDLKIRTTVRRDDKKVAGMESSVFSIGKKGDQVITLSESLDSPEKWTSDTPNLYDLSIELLDNLDRLVDQIDTRIGFKETRIKGNTFFLNGVPIKLHAINSHMQHPVLGHVMDEETIRKDFEILKQFNFNAVRTSHYPPVNKYLELADEYGLFIIDEAGTESHATQYVSEMPEYTEMYRERVRRMVLRDRNHPCVLFWSAGNESGEGENITEVIKEGKRLDATRYWMYGGNADVHPAEDIIGPRYPSPIELEINIGSDTTDKRPSFMDEYLSIAGNGGGGMDDYWRVIYSHPRLMGGAIWDFVSTGVTEPIRTLADQSPYRTPVQIMGNAKLAEGRNGKGIDLNGHDQWVEIYRAENLEVTGDQLTISLDIYPRSLISSSGAIITKGSYQFGLQQKGRDTLNFYIYNGQKQVLSSPLPGNWENNWHQLMAVYDGKQMKLFIDGAETASQEITGDIQDLPFPVNVGRNAEEQGQDADVYLCDAVIDNVGLFGAALQPLAELNPAKALLWLDFEEETHEGDFFSYGIGARTYGAIWPDRAPQPEMWQMKKTVQPLSFTLLDQEKGIVEVWNRSNFHHSSFWRTGWTLTEDDKILQSGILDLDVSAQNRGQVIIPYSKPDIVPGKEYRLNISSSLKADEVWASEGFEISWDQIELKSWNIPETKTEERTGSVKLSTHAKDYVVTGENFTYRFDRISGELKSMLIDGSELLYSPLKLNVWRAPLANELDRWNGITMRSNRWKEGFDMTIATDYYSNGIDNLKSIPLEVRASEENGGVYVYVRELAIVDGGTQKITRRDMYISGKTLSGFESVYEYTISGNGTVNIKHSVMPQGSMPQMLPRIGVTLMVNNTLKNVEWYGRGPQENYPDRKSGYRLGIYHSSVQEMYEPYLIPQDHGLRTENRWLRLMDDSGKGLEFSMNEHFNFNAYPYTTENLTKALYTYQLMEADGITVNLDYNTTGVGGTARPVLDSYRVYPELYSREINISPLY